MTIPNFTNPEHKARFDELFNDYVASYSDLFRVVLRSFYGESYSVDTITPQGFEVIKDLTSSFIYEVENRFEKEHPEYKEDNDFFFTRGRVREEVQVAMDAYLADKTKAETE